MHGGFAILVDRIHVGAEIQRDLQRLQHVALRSGVLAG